jgi:hypothetical protein
MEDGSLGFTANLLRGKKNPIGVVTRRASFCSIFALMASPMWRCSVRLLRAQLAETLEARIDSTILLEDIRALANQISHANWGRGPERFGYKALN